MAQRWMREDECSRFKRKDPGGAVPEQPEPKLVPHPAVRGPLSASGVSGASASRRRGGQAWGELLVQSNHAFLRGASHPEELVAEAHRLGHAGIAMCDAWTFGGSVRAHVAVRDLGGDMRLAHGTRVRLAIGDDRCGASGRVQPEQPLEIALYATDRASWGALCRLLSDVPGCEAAPRDARSVA